MKLLKKYDFIYKYLIFILILTLLLTFVNLIIPINNHINSLISLIMMLGYIFICSIKKGFKVEEKAYLEGFKLGLMYIAILYVLNCLTLNFALPIKKILYFLIIIITSVLGCIIGINKKNSK